MPVLGSTQHLVQVVSSPVSKECEVWGWKLSLSSSADVKNEWICTFTPPQNFVAWTGTLFRAPVEGTCEVRSCIFGRTRKWRSRQELRLLCRSAGHSAGIPVNSVRIFVVFLWYGACISFLVKIIFYPAEGSSSLCHAIRCHVKENDNILLDVTQWKDSALLNRTIINGLVFVMGL